ncbi:Uncharacterised protein [Nocardia otitidiscaviarum]|uniref:Uncharacterized protein n=1 Tax=Nocardia otitidiscaviarum TaxID=1823 RepID=A0A379JIJ2_9NOCA|nr:Uncharacterised protein [Nocardia otitidiscaviarum]
MVGYGDDAVAARTGLPGRNRASGRNGAARLPRRGGPVVREGPTYFTALRAPLRKALIRPFSPSSRALAGTGRLGSDSMV